MIADWHGPAPPSASTCASFRQVVQAAFGFWGVAAHTVVPHVALDEQGPFVAHAQVSSASMKTS